MKAETCQEDTAKHWVVATTRKIAFMATARISTFIGRSRLFCAKNQRLVTVVENLINLTFILICGILNKT
jgi:hypothetical protein